MIDTEQLKAKFIEVYGSNSAPRLFRAPGRVNLIGEHTDYNGGFVLPMAIDRETTVAISVRNDRQIRAFTVNLKQSAEFDLDGEKKTQSGFWLNYIEGVARILEQKGVKLKGADLVIWSDVPTGAGLSSSAALETVMGLALSEISDQPIDRTLLAQIGQQTEHDFVGVKVGIMDQFVSANACSGHALLLDCRNLTYENVPLNTKNVAVVMCDTNIKHELASSEYNTRRAECEKAVEIFKQFLPNVEQLRDVTTAEFEKYADQLPDVVRCRARHVITENERTLNAAQRLKNDDLEGFGQLMWVSHISMRDDYEISCQEIDLLVEIAQKLKGVLGARMTGGGFGGSTVNLVKRENLEEFKKIISTEYHQMTGIELKILVSEASEGASEIAS